MNIYNILYHKSKQFIDDKFVKIDVVRFRIKICWRCINMLIRYSLQILKDLSDALKSPIYLISYIFPKNKNIWIFGAWFGAKFADNPKYLFLYVANNQPNIRPIWLTKNKKIMQQLKQNGYECYHAYSLKGFFYSMRAGVAIISQGLVDVNRFALSRTKNIHLWHGTPLKKIGTDSARGYSLPSYLHNFYVYFLGLINPFYKEDFDLYTASSPEVVQKFCTAFDTIPEKVVVTGSPRNDIFSDNKKDIAEDTNYDIYNSIIQNKIIITYLPTFRDRGLTFDQLFNNYNFDFEKATNFFKENNAIFICRPHSADKTKISSLKSEHLKFFNDDDMPDTQKLLAITDILITDYSGAYFDYLILNKPIIFAPFDLNEYVAQSRELYYDYDSVTPGPKAKNWDDMLVLIKEAIIQPEKYEHKRMEINKIFNDFSDNHNSKRVYEKIVELIEAEK